MKKIFYTQKNSLFGKVKCFSAALCVLAAMLFVPAVANAAVEIVINGDKYTENGVEKATPADGYIELQGFDYVITGSGSLGLYIQSQKNVTLKNVNINSGDKPAIKINVAATLVLEGNNVLTSASSKSIINIEEKGDLTVEGSGILVATGKLLQFGYIDASNTSNITIKDGTIDLTGVETVKSTYPGVLTLEGGNVLLDDYSQLEGNGSIIADGDLLIPAIINLGEENANTSVTLIEGGYGISNQTTDEDGNYVVWLHPADYSSGTAKYDEETLTVVVDGNPKTITIPQDYQVSATDSKPTGGFENTKVEPAPAPSIPSSYTVEDGDKAPGWKEEYDAGGPFAYSGGQYTVTFSGVGSGDLEVDILGDLAKYISGDPEIYEIGNKKVSVTFTIIDHIPADMMGKSVKGFIQLTEKGKGTKTHAVNYKLLNTLVAGKNVNVKKFIPQTTLYGGNLEIDITDGGEYKYYYSIDEGKNWILASKSFEDIAKMKFAPLLFDYLYIKAAGSYNYIVYDVNNINYIRDLGNVSVPREFIVSSTGSDLLVYMQNGAPAVGRHYVQSGDVELVVVINRELAEGEELSVSTGRNLSPESDRLIIWNGDGSYTVVINDVLEPVKVNISITGGPAGSGTVAGSSVWSADGQLYVASATSGSATVYTLAGSTVKTVTLTGGQTAGTSLPAGIYVVILEGKAYKVAVK